MSDAEFYEDYTKIACLAEWMHAEGWEFTDIAYMLHKPWKYVEEWVKCKADLDVAAELSRELTKKYGV